MYLRKLHDTGLLFEHSHSNKVYENRLFQLKSLPLNSGISISWVGGSQGVFNVTRLPYSGFLDY